MVQHRELLLTHAHAMSRRVESQGSWAQAHRPVSTFPRRGSARAAI